MPTKQLTIIRDHIGRGKLDKAIAELINLTKGSDYANDALALSSRYSESQRNNRLGVVSYSEHSLSQNKIGIAVLGILSLIEDDGPINPDDDSGSNRNASSGNIGNQFNGNTFNGPVTFNNSPDE